MTLSTPTTRSNILGVTGLPRAAIAALYRSRGLFGQDSQLAADEQAVIQSRLPALPGVPVVPPPAFRSARLKRLADYVDAVLAGTSAEAERDRLIAEGLSAAAISEAARTVDNVHIVFAAAWPAATAAVAVQPPAYAKAA